MRYTIHIQITDTKNVHEPEYATKKNSWKIRLFYESLGVLLLYEK